MNSNEKEKQNKTKKKRNEKQHSTHKLTKDDKQQGPLIHNLFIIQKLSIVLRTLS